MVAGDEREGRAGRLKLLAALGAVLLFVAVFYARGGFRTGLPGSRLLDPDSYARLLRIESLLSRGGWFDEQVWWDNAPYSGATLHWTRPLDVIVAAAALPMSAGRPLRAAIVSAGFAAPIVFGIGLVIALVWGSATLLSARALLIIGLLAAAQPTLVLVFRRSYVDHHGLMVMLFAVAWAATVRGVTGDEWRRGATVAGIAAGICLWTSTEAVAWIAGTGASLAILWVVEGLSRHAGMLARYFTSSAITAAIALAIERAPGQWLTNESDRISFFHVLLLAMLAIAWSVVSRRFAAAPSTSARRVAVLAAATVVPLLVATATFPRLLAGPTAEIDPRVLALLFQNNQEFTPFKPGDLVYLGLFAGAIGPSLFALIFALSALRSPDVRVRRFSLLTVVLLGIFLPLTLYQWRWGLYVNVIATLPWALAIRAAFHSGERGGEVRRILAPAGAIALVVLPFVVSLLFARAGVTEARRASLAAATTQNDPPTRATPCTFSGLGPLLAKAAGRPARDVIVMTTMFEGPQMAFQTGVRVVGSPYHRNTAGILDTHAVVEGEQRRAMGVLRRRGVDYLVLCRAGAVAAGILNRAPQSLAGVLLRGETPAGLQRARLPKRIDPELLVFRVAGSQRQTR